MTKERAIAFDRIANRFIESRLPIHDEFVVAEADKYLAVVITSGRALGLALGTKTFIDVRLRTGGDFRVSEIKCGGCNYSYLGALT